MYKTFTIKAFFTAVILVWAGLTAGTTQAQQVYGNEWIDYSKTYHKLQVVETGLYKLDYAYLQQLGLESVNPQHLQLFRRGKEVPIYVAGEADGRLDPQDYMEFYGERNDGALDEELYKNPAHQVHQLYSMYTDTAAYFLTVNPAGGNKRMREVNPSPNGLTPEPYHWQKALLLRTTNYSMGRYYGQSSNNMPWMDAGEGFFSTISTVAKTLTFELSGISNVEASGSSPKLELVTVGPNVGSHKFDVNVVGTTTRTLGNIEYGDYGVSKTTHQLQLSDLNIANGKFTFQFVPQAVNGKLAAVGLAYARLVYPQRSIFGGSAMHFYTDSLRSGPLYYEFAQASSSTVAYDVTMGDDIVRIAGHVKDGSKGFVINSQKSSHKVLLANSNAPLVPVAKTLVTFRNIEPDKHNYIIVTNKALMKQVGGSSLPAPKEYAAYRNSVAGGGYDTLLVFIDDLVDQFHFGEFSSNSIRRFASFMKASSREKHLLIIGSGIEIHRVNFRDKAARSLDLVPTFGVPASDMMFSTDFRNNNYVHSMPTGRVFARTPSEVIYYLNKVKEYDAAPEGVEWRKNVLHLGGGKSAAEINTYTRYIKTYTDMAKGPLLGANVIEKTRKNLSDVVESIDISKEVNEGLSLITFFGHSSPGLTDLNIGYPSIPSSNYRNKGKYPVILVNGCNIGNSYVGTSMGTERSLGEDWLNTPDKGAIAFIAHVATGYDYYLHEYSVAFYEAGLTDEAFQGKTLGQVQQEVSRRVIERAKYRGTSDFAVSMALEYVLQGDPAVHLYNPSKPDFLIKENSFYLKDASGNNASALADTIVLEFDVKNLGKAITDSIYLSVKRTFPDNQFAVYDSVKIGPIYNQNRAAIKLPNSGPSIAGMNIFEVKLDSPELIEELNEDNNSLTYQRFLSSNNLATVYPLKYSIVSNTNVTLAVQSLVAKESRGVVFEIDTSATFNSPWRKSATAEKASFATWDVNLINSKSDSIVYFWRARFNTYSIGEDTLWVKNSFRHIPEVDAGWSQSHKGQFTEARAEAFKPLDQGTGKWEFKEVRKFLSLITVGGDIKFTNPPYGLYIDGYEEISWQCGYPTTNTIPRLYMVVFNDVTLEAVTNLGGTAGCRATPYLFDTNNLNTAANRAKIKRFIDAVPEGYHVAIMSVHNVPFDAFPEDAKAALRSIGSKLVDGLKTGDPFVIVGRKGAAPGTAQERTFSREEAEREGGTPRAAQSAELNLTLESHRQSGTITSTIIGPALKWGSLHHDIKPYAGGDDKYKLSLIGINTAGEEVMLVDEVNARNFDISHIDAKQYPNLKLSAFLSDATMRTAPQLKEWFILYDPVPEGVIRPDLVKASSEELTQLAGRGTLTVPMAFQNVTSTAFTDSLTVEVVFSGSGISSTTSRFKIKPVGPNETVYFNHTLATSELDGDYRISFYVNPRLILEQEYSNNIYEVDFGVKSRLHPIMDVAFDGIHILDGDIVSPSPLISVTVKDENRHVFLQDPSKMSVVLIDGEQVQKEINLVNNPEVTYTPATETNDFKLEYKPAKLPDGSYTLQVRATDAVGKESGVSPYKIGFKVVGESSISNFYPFPNPFSTKTNFIFTITGGTIPENIKIQILTVTGKVVKEIMKEELGPLRIGNNKTEYAWDGTDMYGDKLANGVYLYRVVMTRGEEEMKHRHTFGDGAFKNGYGKLYILR
ncbi:interleukin-like EMT inducer protein [Pontibacter mucosus]|uniref:Interleukin-like EMT inducer protein n=1 Tax=Pontibacter mucosus TaxID=1649266 RepID=A0A2T5YHI9_9BACT|nr:C25 family cysteine peptidase [Pontibacter mucosus]PTX18777.1 interleukin-like EMT inducer protein [Pontibacter mucosus]